MFFMEINNANRVLECLQRNGVPSSYEGQRDLLRTAYSDELYKGKPISKMSHRQVYAISQGLGKTAERVLERHQQECQRSLDEQKGQEDLEKMVAREELLQLAIASGISEEELPYRVFAGAY